MSPPPVLRADAERNRQLLLEAAAELFAERGVDVPLTDIAARAGVGVATAYRRFADRDVLIDELFDQRLAPLIDEARAGLDLDDPWEGFVQGMRSVLERMSGNHGLKQLMLGEVRAGDRQARLRAELMPIMRELVERAQAAGELRPDLSVTDIPMLNIMLSAGMTMTQTTEPEHWRRMFAIVLDGLRTRRDGPSELPVAALAPEQLPIVLAPPQAAGAGD